MMATVTISVGEENISGDLTLPKNARSIVLFAHGSGSSRFSPRNRQVAAYLQHAGLATLLFDLLTPSEETTDAETAAYRFDIPLLADRLLAVIDWLGHNTATKNFVIGCFGSSTGAAAALIAAAKASPKVAAVVSRGGRPDLAGEYLQRVTAPTLLIVGGEDSVVIELNQAASLQLGGIRQVAIIPGATHLFEEPGKLETVCSLACEWFLTYLK